MGWSNAPPPKPPPLGKWEAVSYGADYHAWTLRCGAMFWGHVIQARGYRATLNGNDAGLHEKLDDAKDAVERAIICCVREMLPAYRVIYGRVMHRDGKPPDDPPPSGAGLRVVQGEGKKRKAG